MKRVQFICSALALALSVCLSASAQQVFKTTSQSVIGYLEYLPDGYVNNSEKYPVVIFLHGNGEKGNNSTDPAVLNQSISLVTRHGPPKFVKNGYKFPFILISPQLKSNYGTWPTSYIDEVVEHVKTYLRIDESRVYVTGLSLGGGGAWVYAENFSSKIAALAPVCGGSNWPANACRLVQNNLPVWAFHGDKDTVVPLSKSADMVNAINACTPAPEQPAILTVYNGVAHNAWDYAYKTDNSLHTPNVYEWMMAQRNTTNGTNTLPAANAGNDISITSSEVALPGTGTDANGTITEYLWTQLEGPSSAALNNVTSSTLQVSGLIAGAYVFRLTVTDNHNGTDSDYVKVQVNAPSVNQSPVVNAGPDKTITGNSVTLTGIATDSDGNIAAYEWKKISGPPAWLNNPKTTSVTAINLTPGTYTFRFTATDNKGATGYDDAIVVITSGSSTNNPPVANAGPDKTVTLPQSSVTLDGSGSDSDGTIASWEWQKISGPPAWLSNSKTSSLTALNLIAGTYTFRLTVKDDKGVTSSDDAVVTVSTSSSNRAPYANAGPDQTITLPANSVTFSGTGNDLDGSITSYTWSKVSGPQTNMTNVQNPSMTANNLVAGIYHFRLTVTDNNGATGYDNVYVTVNSGSIATGLSYGRYANASVDNDYSEDDYDPFSTESRRLDISQPSNCTVAIFDETGKRIYTGQWRPELYDEVFSTQGLYIYNLQDGPDKGVSGKLYIVKNK